MGAVYEASRKPDPVNGYKGPISWTLNDVEDVLASSNGEHDETDWIAILKLHDGRFVFMSAGCDYTGWDCQAGGRSIVSDDLIYLINVGIDMNLYEKARN